VHFCSNSLTEPEIAETTADKGLESDWHRDTAFLRRAVEIASRCGAHTVTRPGAFAALPDRDDLARLES